MRAEAALQSLGDARASARSALERFGRAGWLGKGTFYLILGTLALRVGLGVDFGDEASRAGVLETIAGQTGGRVVLLLLGASLALYVSWRILTAVLPGGSDAMSALERLGYLASAGFYATVVWAAAEMVWRGLEDAPAGILSSDLHGLLSTAGGRLSVALAGVVGLAVAALFVRKGLAGEHMEQLEGTEWSASYRRWVRKLGTLGWVGRAFVALLFGAFLIHAGLVAGPESTTSLDRILTQIAGTTAGAALVLLAGLGLLTYAAFVLMSWRQRRLRGP